MPFLDNKNIGNRLKAKRIELGITSVRKFAMDAGVDQSQYSKIEKGDLPMTEKILDKLVAKYGLDREFILYGTNVPHETGGADSTAEESSAKYQGKGAVGGDGLKSHVNSPQDAYREKYINLLEKENERKSQIIETNLTGLVIGQKSILAHLAVSMECDALRDAGGDKRKADHIKENMDKRIGEVFSGRGRRDKTSGKLSSGK